MPASYVHEMVARRALVDFSANTPEPDLLLPALLAGAQGPDPFFFFHVLNRKKNGLLHSWATRLHTERTDVFLTRLCEAARQADAPARSFALGFLTHYATDSTAHPFVYAHSFDDNGAYSNNLHGDLEAAMDTYFFRAEGGRHTPRQMTGYAALTGDERTSIAEPFRQAIVETFGSAPTREEILISFRDCVRYPRMLYSSHGVKRRCLSLLARCVGLPGYIEAHTPPARLPTQDFLNLAHMGWASPWAMDTLRHESMEDLLDIARQKSAAFFAAAYDLWAGSMSAEAFAAQLGGLGYDSGVAWERAFFFENGMTLPETCENDGKKV